MKKPELLRARLASAFPELAEDPARLRMWIEKGALLCHNAPDNLNFQVRYTLTVVIESWPYPAILIWALVLDWLRTHQPDLVTPSHTAGGGVSFEADILDTGASDLALELPLTEAIKCERRGDGGFDMTYLGEPDPLFPDSAPMLGDGPILKSIWVEGGQILPDTPFAPDV